MIQLFKIISVIACHSNPDCYISGHIVRKLDPRQDILFLFLSNHLYNKKTTTVKQSSILDNTHMLHFNLSCPHYVIRATGCLLRNHKEKVEQDVMNRINILVVCLIPNLMKPLKFQRNLVLSREKAAHKIRLHMQYAGTSSIVSINRGQNKNNNA